MTYALNKRLSGAAMRLKRQRCIPLPGGGYFVWPGLSVVKPRLNLVVIGAGKAGTTSLHDWLGAHPDIYMSSPVKEVNFFAPKAILEKYKFPWAPRRDTMRQRLGAGYRGEHYLGESSPLYTSADFFMETPIPAEAFRYNPAMKLIYSVRNPYGRIISHFHQEVHAGRLPNICTEIPDDRLEYLTHASCYGHHLKHWTSVFPKSQIKVILFEHLTSSPEATLNLVADFLELPPFPSGLTFKAKNVTSERRYKPASVRLSLKQYQRIRPLIERDLELLRGFVEPGLLAEWDLGPDRWIL